MNGMNPGVRYAWYVTLLLALMYVFSFVDRLILGLVAVDVAKDLDLSDTQLGLLIGTSFAMVYSLAGLPLANMLDRQSRKWLVVAGVGVWAVSTMAAGFATGWPVPPSTKPGLDPASIFQQGSRYSRPTAGARQADGSIRLASRSDRDGESP